MQMTSRPPLRRLVALDRMIRSGEYPNARTMAVQLEVNRRTIYRDLDFLRDSWGAPLEFSPRKKGFYYSQPDYALPLLRLSEGELVALFLAERVMQQYRGTPYASNLATAFRKLTVQLPAEVTLDLSHLDESISFRAPVPDLGDAGRFADLLLAVEEGRRLELLYWSASRDEECRRLVDPYHLTSVQGDWYLVAYCHLREDVRMFVPSRIRSLRNTGEHFERPADFRIGDYLDASFRAMRGDGLPQRVLLRFSGEAARYVKLRQWHPSQRLRELPDGRLQLTLVVSHLLEVRRWVMGYGAECEVVEPAELRDQVREAFRRGIAVYE
jgi:predicted DNA-binding transcriptional regulator YafY